MWPDAERQLIKPRLTPCANTTVPPHSPTSHVAIEKEEGRQKDGLHYITQFIICRPQQMSPTHIVEIRNAYTGLAGNADREKGVEFIRLTPGELPVTGFYEFDDVAVDSTGCRGDSFDQGTTINF